MLIWSEQNERQLERLEFLIQETTFHEGEEKNKVLAEIQEILKNDTLDLDRKMDTHRVPLLILASMWHSQECIKLLLECGADHSATFQLERLMGLDTDPDTEEKDSVQILLEARDNFQKVIQSPEYGAEQTMIMQIYLDEVERCLEVFQTHGNYQG